MSGPPHSSLTSRLAVEAATCAFFVALAVLATRPLIFSLQGATLVGPDPLIDLWTIHWLTGHALLPGQLFHGNIFAPFAYAALHSDLSLGTAVLLLPLRPFVRDPMPLYNLGVLLALAFGGWSFQALARGLGASRGAALVAGTLAAFGSHQLFHVYHLNLLSSGWLALFLLGLQRLLERPSAGAVALCGLAFALNALSSGYYAVAAVVLAPLFALWHWRRFDRRRLMAALLATLVGALLLAPYLRGYAALRHETTLRRPPGLSVRMAFQPARDLGSRALVGRALVGAGEGGEKLFPGVVTLALAALALARRRPQAGFYAAAVSALTLLSLGPRLEVCGLTLDLPYAWLAGLPPFDSMRHPYTFAAVAVMLLAVLAALGAEALPAAWRRRVLPLVVALAVIETVGPPVAVRPLPRGVPAAYAAVARREPGIVLELPVNVPESLLWAARHGLPTANGNGAFAPAETLRLQNLIARNWLARAPATIDGSPPAELLRDIFGVRYVILPAGRPIYRRLARAFDAARTFTLLESFPDGARLYELRSRLRTEPEPGLASESACEPAASQSTTSPHASSPAKQG